MSPNWLIAAAIANSRRAGLLYPTDPELPTTLLGVGSADNSLISYPKTGPVTEGDWFVDPNAASNGVGTEADPFDNLASALSAASGGDTILVKAGTLQLSSRITRSAAYTSGAPLRVFAYGTDRPILDGSNLTSGSTSSQILRFSSGASYEHWKGFEFTNGKGIGCAILGNHITIEDCWFHDITVNDTVGGAAMRVQDSTAFNCVIKDCAFWKIGDPSNGSLGSNQPDCIQFTSVDGAVTTGHVLARSFFANGPDDCVDLFRSSNVQVLDCVAVDGGRFWTGAAGGDGGNFKMGGSGIAAIGDNFLIGSLSIRGRSEAIKPNSAPNPITALRCTQVDAENYGFNFSQVISGDKHVVTDCIEINSGNANSPGMNSAYVTATFNSWQLGIADPDFASPAAFDWSLAAGSDAIGASSTGGNLGASVTALAIAKEWLAKDLT